MIYKMNVVSVDTGFKRILRNISELLTAFLIKTRRKAIYQVMSFFAP